MATKTRFHLNLSVERERIRRAHRACVAACLRAANKTLPPQCSRPQRPVRAECLPAPRRARPLEDRIAISLLPATPQKRPRNPGSAPALRSAAVSPASGSSPASRPAPAARSDRQRAASALSAATRHSATGPLQPPSPLCMKRSSQHDCSTPRSTNPSAEHAPLPSRVHIGFSSLVPSPRNNAAARRRAR